VVQALIELVKNSYDADATYAKITIDTQSAPPSDSAFPSAKGYILVEDDGNGMNKQSINDGWLTIANSSKRVLKAQGGTTPIRKRTPLGDKGLGRLGVQRLGHNVEITTRPLDTVVGKPAAEDYHVSFSWDDFLSAKRLSDVPVELQENAAPTLERGTRILISDLKEAETWRDGEAEARLRDGLSRLLSPYKKFADFRVYPMINGRRIELAEVSDAVRRTSQVHYDIAFDGTRLVVTGRARLAFFRPPSGRMRHRFKELVESDGGRTFLAHVKSLPVALDVQLQESKNPGWFVEYSEELNLDKLDKKSFVDPGVVANPGPFNGEIDAFNLGAESVAEAIGLVKEMFGSIPYASEETSDDDTDTISVFNSLDDYRKYIKDLSGIRVYRDGFGIRVDPDWLGLASERTSGKSYYSLRPSNTLGYIALTARDNAVLTEKTDREGFQLTPYFLNFHGLLKQAVGFANESQDFLRRAWVGFEKRSRLEVTVPDLFEATRPEQAAAQIQETLSSAESFRAPVLELLARLERSTNSARALLDTRSTSKGDLRKSLLSMTDLVPEAAALLRQVEIYLDKAAEANPLSVLLAEQMSGLKERLDEVYSMVSLGLTAEALSHEIHNVADQLAARNQMVSDRIQKQPHPDAQLITFTEYIRSAIEALRKQLSHLAPSLKYVRERRETIIVPSFLSTLADFHRDRLAASGIRVEVLSSQPDDFIVDMNRGKLTQIFDNLLLNSEYWLKEDLRGGSIQEGIITMESARPFVRVWDNGGGISKSVENRLFTPFVTTKRRGEGRGLGLFITRQLLDADACSIELSSKRNAQGNRYLFEINLAGALTAGR